MHRLEKYITQVRGISYSPKDISGIAVDDYVPVLKANNIQGNYLKTDRLIYIHRSKIKPEQFIRRGDILIAASSGSKDIVGKSVFFDEEFNGSFGAFCKVIRPNKEIHAQFVSAFFKTPEYRRHIRRVIQGANINNLRTEDIAGLKIPIFPFDEQIKIAEVLSKAEELIAQRKESITLLDEYLKSTFLEMFGDPIFNPNNWPDKRIEDLCIYIVDCINKTAPTVDKKTDFKMIRTTNVRDFKVNLKEVRFVEEETFHEWNRRLKPQKGDIIFTREAPMGEAGILESDENVFLGQRTMLYRSSPKLVNKHYLLFQLMGRDVRRQIGKLAMGSTVQHLSVPACKKFIIQTPPIDLQNQFGQIVEKTEALKSHYQESLRELEKLFGSLSQLAFKGELDLSRMEAVVELKYEATDNDRTESKRIDYDKVVVQPKKKKAAPQPEIEKSVWETTRLIKGSSKKKLAFNSLEGDAVLKAAFLKKAKGFTFKELEAYLFKENFEYDYAQLKDFVFEKLEAKELTQYYADRDWMENYRKPHVNPRGDDFGGGDGSIWFVPNSDLK